MRRVPGAPKGRRGPMIAPQHRMVFGLFVMASAAFVLSVAFRKGEDQDAADTTPPPDTVVVSRVALPSPTPGTVTVGAVATDAVLGSSVQELRAALDACTTTLAAHFGDRGGELRVDLVLDAGGLLRAELVGAHLPEPPAIDCLAEAVHARAWPTVVGDPMELRVPFYVVLPLKEAPVPSPELEPAAEPGATGGASGAPAVAVPSETAAGGSGDGTTGPETESR